MKLFDPHLVNLTPAHTKLFQRYAVLKTLVDFGAAAAFVVGSICFFYPKLDVEADWFFLVGSILFAAKPTIDVARQLHLIRLPTTSPAA